MLTRSFIAFATAFLQEEFEIFEREDEQWFNHSDVGDGGSSKQFISLYSAGVNPSTVNYLLDDWLSSRLLTGWLTNRKSFLYLSFTKITRVEE